MTTLEEFTELQDRLWIIKRRKDEIKLEEKQLNVEKAELEDKLEKMLELQGTNNCQSSGGKISKAVRESYQTPKTLEERKAMFDIFMERYGEETTWGIFGANSQALNSRVKEITQTAIELEEDMPDFEFLGPKTTSTTFRYTAAKR